MTEKVIHPQIIMLLSNNYVKELCCLNVTKNKYSNLAIGSSKR